MGNYFERLYEMLKKEQMLSRRTALDGPKMGAEAILDRNGNFLLEEGGSIPPGCTILEEKIALRPHLVFIGAGHVAKALYDLASTISLDVTVLDDRAELNTADRFPKAKRLTAPLEKLFKNNLDLENPYFAIFTHGHSYDEEGLEYALRHRNAGYIGMIGSKGKVAHTYEHLSKKGFSEERLSAVHAPIGLPINAATPEEIAVSIMAEMIGTYRKDKRQISVEPGMLTFLSHIDKPVIRARIVAKSGSGPREQGTEMAIGKDVTFMTIGGGAIENESIRIARLMLESGQVVRLEKFDMSAESDLGMACGGKADVLFTLVLPE